MVADEVVADEVAADEVAVDEVAADEVAVDEVVADEVVADEVVVDEVVVDEVVADPDVSFDLTDTAGTVDGDAAESDEWPTRMSRPSRSTIPGRVRGRGTSCTRSPATRRRSPPTCTLESRA